MAVAVQPSKSVDAMLFVLTDVRFYIFVHDCVMEILLVVVIRTTIIIISVFIIIVIVISIIIVIIIK